MSDPGRHHEAPRYLTLDVIRGVAVLGILVLNIVSFALPQAAHGNPLAGGGTRPLDLATFLTSYVLFDDKMRGLFATLFGASMLLVMDRAEASGRDPVGAHLMRMGWLLVFGLAHLWLLWAGDTLHHYALVGLLVTGARGQSARWLATVGLLLLAIEWLLSALAISAADTVSLQASFGPPSPVQLRDEIALHTGPYAIALADRWAHHATTPYDQLIEHGWETAGYMLLGMAGLRAGLLTGEWPAARVRRWMLAGFGLGLPLTLALAAHMLGQGFSASSVAWATFATSRLAAPPMVLGWAGLLVLLARREGWLRDRLAAAGRMAFSNYIATTLICLGLFDGLGLFARLSRVDLLLVVMGVWVAILLWSAPWLRHFRHGPLEWLWRSLARRRIEPLRR